MSFEPEHDRFFQYATFGVLGVAVAVCLCFGLIFMNPRVNPIGALRPAGPTVLFSAFEFPATWTPTPTVTLTPTPPYTPTQTPTNTPTITPLPTSTPVPTDTPVPPPTRIPPTPRPRPVVPPTSPPPPPPTASLFPFTQRNQGCFHSGQTFVEGTVYGDTTGASILNGVKVRLSYAPGGPPVADDVSGSHGGRPGYYILFIGVSGSRPGDWAVWVVDDAGKALSDPNAGTFHTNALGPDNPSSCWRQVYDFGKLP